MSKNLRSALYKMARVLGDINAVSKGRTGKRIARRAAGKMAGRGLGKSGCFVATAVYGDAHCSQVNSLRRLRDSVLVRSLPGRVAIALYYGGGGELLARFVEKHCYLKRPIRRVLDRMAACSDRRT